MERVRELSCVGFFLKRGEPTPGAVFRGLLEQCSIQQPVYLPFTSCSIGRKIVSDGNIAKRSVTWVLSCGVLDYIPQYVLQNDVAPSEKRERPDRGSQFLARLHLDYSVL